MILCLNKMRVDALVVFARYGFYALIMALTIAGLFKYTGNSYIYVMFSVVSNALLYIGFRNNAFFFDAFIGVFLWLGFWLKLTVRVIFFEGLFHEPVGSFDGSGNAFDYALLVTSCGLFGLLVASFVREKFIFTYPKISKGFKQYGILNFYRDYRQFVLTGFVILILFIALTNIYFGIYQRGEIARTILPYGLNGIYKWLLLFGLTSVTAVIWHCELHVKRDVSYWIFLLSLFESMVTNVAMLSRGMILNVSALAYGIYMSLKIYSIRLNLRILLISFLVFIILFMSSVFLVNYMRATDIASQSERISTAQTRVNSLFLDRWVGIEGVMAVSSYHKTGWALWSDAWREKYSENTMTLYDRDLISSSYSDEDLAKKHSITMPGILAFCFYPGSIPFLIGCMFLLGLFAALIEISVFKMGGNNLILCSLLAEVVAYRFANFGYVPAQSYLLFGTIFLNLFIIYFLNRVLGVWNDKK